MCSDTPVTQARVLRRRDVSDSKLELGANFCPASKATSNPGISTSSKAYLASTGAIYLPSELEGASQWSLICGRRPGICNSASEERLETALGSE